MSTEKIGLIAGRGKLPFCWLQRAKARNKKVYIFSLIGELKFDLKDKAEEFYKVNIGQLGKLLDLIQKHGLDKVIFLGKIEKKDIFNQFNPDLKMKKMLSELDQLSDDLVLKKIGNYFAENDIKVLNQSTFMKDKLPGAGLLTSASPSEELIKNLEFGLKMAREIGKLDIGQTVIVKEMMVLAVEAVEGTDATIKRGARLGQTGIIMAKASKPQQDFRFDIPTVGLKTINLLKEAQAAALVFEANKTFFLEKEKFIQTAEEADITLMGIE